VRCSPRDARALPLRTRRRLREGRSERERAPTRACVGGLQSREPCLGRRGRRLRVSSQRNRRGRSRRGGSPRLCCACRALARRVRRPPSAPASPDGLRPPSLRPLRRDRRRRRRRCGLAPRLRARGRGRGRGTGIQIRAGGVHAVARLDARRADGSERRREHRREHRSVRRAGARRAAPRRCRNRNRLRGEHVRAAGLRRSRRSDRRARLAESRRRSPRIEHVPRRLARDRIQQKPQDRRRSLLHPDARRRDAQRARGRDRHRAGRRQAYSSSRP